VFHFKQKETPMSNFTSKQNSNPIPLGREIQRMFLKEECKMSKPGGIEFEGLLGGIRIINKPATSLPQDLATAIGEINEGLLGATYVPLWIIGDQIVNGIN
jgi:hypothetical protein